MTYPPTQIHTLFSSLSHYKNNLKEKKETDEIKSKQRNQNRQNQQAKKNNNNKIQTRSKRETFRYRGIHLHIRKHNKDAKFDSNNIQSKLIVYKNKYSHKEV